MKISKIVFISICVIILGVACITGINSGKKSDEEILEDGHIQVEVLHNIYDQVTKAYEDYTVMLDESCLYNYLTQERYSDNEIVYLKSIETTSKDVNSPTYVISQTYNDNILTVTVECQTDGSGSRNYFSINLNEDKKVEYNIAKPMETWGNTDNLEVI